MNQMSLCTKLSSNWHYFFFFANILWPFNREIKKAKTNDVVVFFVGITLPWTLASFSQACPSVEPRSGLSWRRSQEDRDDPSTRSKNTNKSKWLNFELKDDSSNGYFSVSDKDLILLNNPTNFLLNIS